MEPLPYYKWHWRDYRANRRVQRMSWQAKGLYRELLDEFWAEGFLPLDHEELAIICGCTLDEFEEYWPQIKGCWEETPDGLVNAKMDSQRTVTDSTRVTNAKNGSAGARAKLANAKRPPSGRHIEEKRREEKSKEEQKPSRDKREGNPMHSVFKGLIQDAWTEWGNPLEMPWDGAEGKQLGMLIGANPKLGPDGLRRLLQYRARSNGINLAERPSKWIRNLTDYARGPLNQFKQPETTGNGNFKGKSDATLNALQRSIEADANQAPPGEVGGEEAGADRGSGVRCLLGGSGEILPPLH